MNSSTLKSQTPTDIESAWSVATFERLSHVWQKKLTTHLQSKMSADGRVLNWLEPADAIAQAESLLTSGGHTDTADREQQFSKLIDQMLSAGQNLHHPRYIGHQVPASSPVAGLFDALGSVTNQPMAIYEMGPWATAVEHALVRTLCRKVGWDADNSTGLLTSGGSLANLTALLTARNVRFPESWEHGLPPNVVVFAHSDAHYCVTRAAGILGLGTANIRKAKLDARRRIDPQQLDDAITREKSSGNQVMAVSAAACATPIGAFDPLNDVADVCRKHNVWLHVDAAHGGAALMSSRHRHLLCGIDQADSVVWDAHKMMFVPALCAAVLYRDKSHRFATFQQDAPYLFDPSNPGMAEFDNGTRTVECTKRSLGFGLWGLWSMYGETIFEQLVDYTFELAAYLHEQLNAAEDFEPMHTPECNIVVFRHLPQGVKDAPLEEQNQFQQRLRAALVASGDFYIVQTRIDGVAALRTVVMNPLTARDRIDELLNAIRHLGKQDRA